MPSSIARLLEQPASEGGRHTEMLKLVPALFRAGWDDEQIFDLLRERYDDDVADREIESVIRYFAKLLGANSGSAYDKSARAKRYAALSRLRQRIARSLDGEILRHFQWPHAAIMADSPVPMPAEPLEQTWAFLARLWQPDDRLWLGVTAEDSGRPQHARNFMTIDDAYWRVHDGWRPEFVSQCSFQPGTVSRCNNAVMTRRYFVVESDVKNGGLGRDEIGAVFRWLAEAAGFVLRAVVFSGNASLHGWFEWKPDQPFDELCTTVEALRCDPQPLKTTQPVRLAGVCRRSTNQLQTLLYLS